MSQRFVTLGPRRLFTVDGAAYCWEDVLAWAAACGLLDEQRNASRRGVVRARGAAESGDDLDRGKVSAAAEQFRYQRRLLAAEELDAWLARWELTVREWGAYLERTLLPARAGEEPESSVPAALPEEVVDEAAFVDAVCSGFLERAALGLAADVALAELGSGAAAGDRSILLERTIAAAAAARESAKSGSGVERELSRRRLDWTRLEVEVLELADQGAAREAALCVRLDGRELADVAAECGGSVTRTTVLVADLEPRLRPSLLAAQAGELVGPLEGEASFLLLAVRERTPPASTDPAVRARAEGALLERAVKRAIDGRVEWHEHL